MATIRDIAKAAGVGIGTVSRALNGNGYIDAQKKENIAEIARQLHYEPVKSVREKVEKSGMIGVILPDISQPFFGSFLRYVEAALFLRGYHVVVMNAIKHRERVSEAINLVHHNRLDGIILNTDVTKIELEKLKEIPVVSLECELGEDIPLVVSDHIKGGQWAAKLLFQCGCKNVVILSAKATTPVYARHRIEECQKYLVKKGIRVTIVESIGKQTSYQEVREIINHFLNTHPDMDGVFTDDIEAYYCLAQAKKRGIVVPRDLKIVGYDGNEITKMISPQITTIAQNTMELAETCADVICKRIEKEETDSIYMVPVKVRKGGTTE